MMNLQIQVMYMKLMEEYSMAEEKSAIGTDRRISYDMYIETQYNRLG